MCLLSGASTLIIMGSNQAHAQLFGHSNANIANRYATPMQQAPVVPQTRYIHQNQFNRQNSPTTRPIAPIASNQQIATARYAQPLPTTSGLPENYKQNFWEKLTGKNKQYYANYSDQMRGQRLPQYQVRPAMPNPLDQFQRWSNAEPVYTLYPGDQVDIVVRSAPELSRTLTVGPDGRVSMPMTKPVMAAGRTLADVQTDLAAQLGSQLRDPRIDVTPRAYGPQQIYVGGEVAAQGTYTLPGPIGALEAILMAGGFQNSARTHHVVILRRAANGGFMARMIDFKDGLHNVRSFSDNVQMKRGDIVFVPRNNISEINLFMQNMRGALPFDLSLSYNIGDGITN